MEYLIIQQYLIFLLGVMITAGIIKDNNLLGDLFILIDDISSKRLKLFLISLIGGILPIPGRVTLSAGILDSLAPNKGKEREKFGIVDYISTHHYYLWSPLEKTVILPMAVLSITYGNYISYMWPLVLITFLYIAWYIFYIVKEEDLVLNINTKIFDFRSFVKGSLPLILGILFLASGYNPAIVFTVIAIYYILNNQHSIKNIPSYINWHLVILLAIILVISVFAKSHFALFEQLLENNHSIIFASILAFGTSWLMGSSGKYASLASLLILVFGQQYLVWFLTIEFIAYNLSPTHKCVHIGRMYFGTSVKEYFKVIVLWQILLFIYAFISTFLL
jgi:hypothetical protein